MTPIPATLVYYPDDRPGISRQRRGRGFSYLAPDGTRIDDRAERKRLAALAVPPAYRDVWISPKPNGHLQATGRDERERKQYRYHPDWTAFRAETKFQSLEDFGRALPRIRARYRRSLSGDAGEQSFAIAAVVAMIDRLSIRVGHPEYAEENGTFGATTLKTRHLELGDDDLRISYQAKGAKKVTRKVRCKTLMRTLEKLDDLPGAELVNWIDDDGEARAVTSTQINAWLAEVAGDGMTAKTFRTWNGSVAALEAARKADKVTIKAMSEAAAARLANTPTIARNSYIHPAVIDLSENRDALPEKPSKVSGLRMDERRLLDLLDCWS